MSSSNRCLVLALRQLRNITEMSVKSSTERRLAAPRRADVHVLIVRLSKNAWVSRVGLGRSRRLGAVLNGRNPPRRRRRRYHLLSVSRPSRLLVSSAVAWRRHVAGTCRMRPRPDWTDKQFVRRALNLPLTTKPSTANALVIDESLEFDRCEDVVLCYNTG